MEGWAVRRGRYVEPMRLCSACNFVTVLGLALGGRRRHHAHDARRRRLPLTRRRAGILRLRNGVERCLRPSPRLPAGPGRASAIQTEVQSAARGHRRARCGGRPVRCRSCQPHNSEQFLRPTAHPYLQRHSSLAWRQQWAKGGGDAPRPKIGSSAARDAAAAIREDRHQR